jgi:DNA polymerase-3 subunit gamma/tau
VSSSAARASPSTVVAASTSASALAPHTPVQPDVTSAQPVRSRPPSKEPPPWLDVPFEGEVVESNNASSAREGVARLPSRNAPVIDQPSRAAKAVFTPSELGERWAEIVRSLIEAGSISAFARELALQSQCVALDEEAPVVMCRLRVEREVLRSGATCEKLQSALAEKYGRAALVEVESGAALDSPAMRDAAERERRQAQAEQIIHDDPLVQALMAQYKTARIVPGSVKPH